MAFSSGVSVVSELIEDGLRIGAPGNWSKPAHSAVFAGGLCGQQGGGALAGGVQRMGGAIRHSGEILS